MTITRFRTGHFDDMKINAGFAMTYVKYRNCSKKELSPSHTFRCSAKLAILQIIGTYPFDRDLYTEIIIELARAVTKVHGSI